MSVDNPSTNSDLANPSIKSKDPASNTRAYLFEIVFGGLWAFAEKGCPDSPESVVALSVAAERSAYKTDLCPHRCLLTLPYSQLIDSSVRELGTTRPQKEDASIFRTFVDPDQISPTGARVQADLSGYEISLKIGSGYEGAPAPTHDYLSTTMNMRDLASSPGPIARKWVEDPLSQHSLLNSRFQLQVGKLDRKTVTNSLWAYVEPCGGPNPKEGISITNTVSYSLVPAGRTRNFSLVCVNYAKGIERTIRIRKATKLCLTNYCAPSSTIPKEEDDVSAFFDLSENPLPLSKRTRLLRVKDKSDIAKSACPPVRNGFI
ncbi:MAG: hypothetical protein AAGC60_26785 [Acidobacteriota bacterium]